MHIHSQTGTVPGKSWLARIWSGFDTKYMKPLLTHSNPTLMETLPECCLPLARVFTSSEQLAKHPAMMRINREDSNTLYDDNISQQMAADDNAAAVLEAVVNTQPSANSSNAASQQQQEGNDASTWNPVNV